jgi:hypothetical protein
LASTNCVEVNRSGLWSTCGYGRAICGRVLALCCCDMHWNKHVDLALFASWRLRIRTQRAFTNARVGYELGRPLHQFLVIQPECYRPMSFNPVSPNKHMQRAGTHKVLGRGRARLVPSSAPRARVLKAQRAGADVNR